MTENELIKILEDKARNSQNMLNNFLDRTGGELKQANRDIDMCNTVKSILEEIQQYRELGTVEQCRKSLEIVKAMIERNITPEIIEEYMKFEDECVQKGFSFSSLLEAREKQRAKKPIRIDMCTCPNCGTYNETVKKRRNTVNQDIVYCWHCGQAIEVKRSEEE